MKINKRSQATFYIGLILLLLHFSSCTVLKMSKNNIKDNFYYQACVLETDSGKIHIMLYEDIAPKHTSNFKKLIKENFYAGISFHRVIKDFVIQAGDEETIKEFKKDTTVTKKELINAEIKKLHGVGSVGAARSADNVNPQRKSNSTQFYICLKAQPKLNNKYTVFGRVSKGMSIVEKIGNLQTDKNDVPLIPFRINKTYLQRDFDEVRYSQYLKFKKLEDK